MDQNRQDYKRLRGPHYTAKAEYIVVETKLQVAARTRAIEKVFSLLWKMDALGETKPRNSVRSLPEDTELRRF